MPIYNHGGKIIGVTQLINKHNRQPFNENDANIIEVSTLIDTMSVYSIKLMKYIKTIEIKLINMIQHYVICIFMVKFDI